MKITEEYRFMDNTKLSPANCNSIWSLWPTEVNLDLMFRLSILILAVVDDTECLKMLS